MTFKIYLKTTFIGVNEKSQINLSYALAHQEGRGRGDNVVHVHVQTVGQKMITEVHPCREIVEES